jgi:hypothetical protein
MINSTLGLAALGASLSSSQSDSGGGTDLCWTVLVQEPLPDDALIGRIRKRMNQLINADLRYSFGQ